MSSSKKSIIKNILKRLLYPTHLWKVIQLQRNRKRNKRVYDDAQLKLYHRILPGDFLHYGYFDEVSVHPLDMSLNMIYKAQERYSEKLVELVTDKESEILDVGCGMGGMLGVMNNKQLKATGLTPDKNQAAHIRQKYPNTLLECRFEELDAQKYTQHFGTVITSESLQYLVLEEALPLIQKILKPGGRWIACDYFKIGNEGEKSGHNWEYFTNILNKYKFKIVSQQDITLHILPTIAYVHHWAAQIGLPVKEFALHKLQVKAPGIYYALENSLPVIDEKIDKNIATIDPALFIKNKKYILMGIERQ